jgi:dihydrofolate synthase / folylpolyglutamate synthase
LIANGLTVGTYTSPDLHSVNERLVRDGEPISDAELAETLEALAMLESMLPERPTRFELLTAAAFRWFADVAVDVAVVEVGLGGRWDATNVVEPDVSVVTNVSYDHVEILGPTLADIAREKAGIVKRGSRLVLGVTQPELLEIFRAAANAADVFDVWVRDEDFACQDSRVAVGGRLLDLRTPGELYSEVYLPHGGRGVLRRATGVRGSGGRSRRRQGAGALGGRGQRAVDGARRRAQRGRRRGHGACHRRGARRCG